MRDTFVMDFHEGIVSFIAEDYLEYFLDEMLRFIDCASEPSATTDCLLESLHPGKLEASKLIRGSIN